MWFRVAIALYLILLTATEALILLDVLSAATSAGLSWLCLFADIAMIVGGVLGVADRPRPGQERLSSEALVIGLAFVAGFWHFFRGFFLNFPP